MKSARLPALAFVPGCALVLACSSQPVSQPVEGAVAGMAGKPATARGGSSFTAGGGDGGTVGGAGVGAAGTAAGGAAGSADAGAGGADAEPCSASALEGLTAFAEGGWDPLGYPPYALDGCSLVYVAAAEGAESGALHLRNLATGQDQVLQDAAQHPRRPTVAGAVVAWESDGASGSQVHVRYSGGAQLLERSFALAAEPRAASDAVVFTAFQAAGATADTDVQLFDVMTQELMPMAAGVGQQRFADVSATHVAFTDFAEDPKGYFDQTGSISDIVVVERTSLERTVRAASGKQAFPLLGEDGVLAYLAWGAVHPEPKFSQFRLMAGKLGTPVASDVNVKGTDTPVNTNPAYVRPSLRGSYLDYIDEVAGQPQLFRANLATLAPPVAANLPGAQRLLGPVAGDSLTLLAKPLEGASLSLVAVAR
ncbi:MAG TPA: hypothetical protein VHP33_32115 [Polyangiaceae bacterium]|nr:hypothetical protein [Polyangiaceae bacterium]